MDNSIDENAGSGVEKAVQWRMKASSNKDGHDGGHHPSRPHV